MRAKGFTGGLFAGKKPSALVPTEANVSAGIKKYLDLKADYNDRINSGRVEVVKKYKDRKTGKIREFTNWVMLARKGTPDRFFIVKGRSGFVEVKKPGGLLSPEQIERHRELRKAGAVVIVAHSVESFARQYEEHFT